MSFYVSTATFFLLHCDEWDRVVALPRHKFVTGATLLQLTLDRLVRGYKLSRFCTLPRKSRRFMAREQKLVYSILRHKEAMPALNVIYLVFAVNEN